MRKVRVSKTETHLECFVHSGGHALYQFYEKSPSPLSERSPLSNPCDYSTANSTIIKTRFQHKDNRACTLMEYKIPIISNMHENCLIEVIL